MSMHFSAPDIIAIRVPLYNVYTLDIIEESHKRVQWLSAHLTDSFYYTVNHIFQTNIHGQSVLS